MFSFLPFLEKTVGQCCGNDSNSLSVVTAHLCLCRISICFMVHVDCSTNPPEFPSITSESLCLLLSGPISLRSLGTNVQFGKVGLLSHCKESHSSLHGASQQREKQSYCRIWQKDDLDNIQMKQCFNAFKAMQSECNKRVTTGSKPKWTQGHISLETTKLGEMCTPVSRHLYLSVCTWA